VHLDGRQTADIAPCDPAPSRAERAVPWIDLALLLVPFATAVVVLVAIGSTFHAVSDQAYEEMLVRDVGHHAVLVGPYSRDNWNHLGPAMFYVLAVPYRLFGGNSVGMWIGAVAVNAAAVTLIAFIAKRHGGSSLMVLMIFGSAVAIRALGADFVRDPWNPYLPVFSFGALIFLVWAMSCGDAWALPVAAAVATFCVQTHIGYVPLAFPLFGIGAVWLIVLAVKPHGSELAPSRRSLVRAGAATAGVLSVMWLPPLLEQVTHSPGNMTKVVGYFRHPPAGARHTWLQGARAVFGQFWIVPEWVKGPATANPFSGESPLIYRAPAPILLIGFVLAFYALWRRRGEARGAERGWRLAAIISAALVLGVVSIERTTGAAYDYRTRWTLLIAMIATAVSLWTGWTLLAGRLTPSLRRSALLLGVLPIAIVAGLDTTAAVRAGTPQRPMSASMQRLGTATLAELPARKGAVIVESPDAITGALGGLVLWLERHGVKARVDPQYELAAGRHRSYRGGEIRAVLTIASDTNADDYAMRADQGLVAATTDFHVEARQRVIAEIADVNRAYREHRLTARAAVERLGELTRELGHVTAVFMSTSS
jgi:hypothetical protein